MTTSPAPRRSEAWIAGLVAAAGLGAALLIGIAPRLTPGARTAAAVGVATAGLVGAASLARRARRDRAAESAVAERERRLNQAQRLEAVGRLAGGLAHDLNNVLAAVRAHCELVLGKPEMPPERLRSKMELVIDTTLRGSSLIERLLTFARRQPTRPELVRLDEIFEALSGVLRGGLPDGAELVISAAGDLWPVAADLAQLEQVVANLVVNARDAIGPGGRIVVSAANVESEGGDRVRLEVADDGEGIPEDVLDHVFEPFFTTRESRGNSGLGLATVYGIVRQSGGEIAIDSRPGEGTRVTVLLPRAADRPAAPSALAPSGGGRILVVDDNDGLRSAIAELLAPLGWTVDTASGLDEALAAADRHPPDLVITDVRLPTVEGPELVARLRERAPVRALYMSGYTDRISLRGGPARGDAFFLKKPFSGEGLVRMVAEMMRDSPP